MERGLMMGSVSTVVEAEVMVKPLRNRDWLALDRLELFFGNSPNLIVKSFDRTIARRAALVRASSRLALPDAIIVATALEDRCEALIGNDSSMSQQTLGLPYLHLNDYIS
jgi:predicted nucleic acid-binding protein